MDSFVPDLANFCANPTFGVYQSRILKPRMPKIPGATRNGEKQRHNPLSEDYSPTVPLKQKAGKKRKATQQDEDDTTVDSKASRQILRIGQDLIEEVEHEEAKTRPNPAFAFDSRGLEEVDEEEDQTYGGEEDEEVWGDEEDEPLDEVTTPLSCKC